MKDHGVFRRLWIRRSEDHSVRKVSSSEVWSFVVDQGSEHSYRFEYRVAGFEFRDKRNPRKSLEFRVPGFELKRNSKIRQS